MEQINQALEYIGEELKKFPQLIHASNILNKCSADDANKVSAAQQLALEYVKYLKAQLSIVGCDAKDIYKRVELLNKYYAYYDDPKYNLNKLFSAQGKLRPTILEEFFFFLFKDYLEEMRNKVNDKEIVIGVGPAKAYTNLYFSPQNFKGFVSNPSIKINEKDQDFAIFRNVVFDVKAKKQKTYEAKVPIFAIEVKTYLDKTMLEGTIATAEKLKMGNPYSRFIVATETYQVGKDVDPSYSQIDQIYVLRKQYGTRKKIEKLLPINEEVVFKLFSEAKIHIERPWSDMESKLENEGVII